LRVRVRGHLEPSEMDEEEEKIEGKEPR